MPDYNKKLACAIMDAYEAVQRERGFTLELGRPQRIACVVKANPLQVARRAYAQGSRYLYFSVGKDSKYYVTARKPRARKHATMTFDFLPLLMGGKK